MIMKKGRKLITDQINFPNKVDQDLSAHDHEKRKITDLNPIPIKRIKIYYLMIMKRERKLITGRRIS